MLDRDDSNYAEVVDGVVNRVREIAGLELEVRNQYRENAREVAQIALWDNQIADYKEAYSEALEKVRGSLPTYKIKEKTIQYMKSELNNPSWRTVLVTRHLPAKLSPLERLSKNLW